MKRKRDLTRARVRRYRERKKRRLKRIEDYRRTSHNQKDIPPSVYYSEDEGNRRKPFHSAEERLKRTRELTNARVKRYRERKKRLRKAQEETR